MPIQLTCQCGASFTARDELVGQLVECMTCGQKMQVPTPHAAPQAVQYMNSPQAVPQHMGAAVGGATSAAAKWPMIAGIAALIGVAGFSGIMAIMQSNKNSELAEKIKLVSSGQSVDKATLEAAQLAANERMASLSDDLSSAKSQQRTEAGNLRRLESTARNHRNEISAIENEIGLLKTNDAVAKVKREEFNRQLVEEKRKLSEAEGKVTTLMRDMSLSKLRITNLETDIANQKKRTERLSSTTPFDPALMATTLDITALNNRIAAIPAAIAGPPGPVGPAGPAGGGGGGGGGGSGAVPLKTVIGEDKAGTNWYVFQLDTETGSATYWDDTNVNSIGQLPAPNIPGDPGTKLQGRFDIKITFDASGDVYDAILIDTQCGLVWNYIPNAAPIWSQVGFVNPAADSPPHNDNWRIDVDPANTKSGGTSPRIVLSNTKDASLIYTDSAFPRVSFSTLN